MKLLKKLVGWLFSKVVVPKNFRAVFLDIETFSTEVDARIMSVGLVYGDLTTGDVIDRAQYNITEEDQMDRSVSTGTLEFWERQDRDNPHARTINCMNQLNTVDELLDMIDEFMKDKQKTAVFGNGPEFDNAIIAHLYQSRGRKVPWRYGDNQSVRTMVLLGRLFGIDPKYVVIEKRKQAGVIDHTAVGDALMEFEYCSIIYRELLAKLLC
jgi:hypothetical protein